MAKIETVQDIRKAFQEFFVKEAHTAVPSASLIAHGDETLLFVNSGMVPFKDCFTGVEKRGYTRATSCQRSLRVSGKHNDYSAIGTTPRHHTFFEMLGNFSFGDYFKKEAIEYGWKFVTEVLALDKSMLWVTVHEKDEEAAKLWAELTDVNPDRIVKLGDDTNRWAMGEFGPNGYCSEIFFYNGDAPDNQSLEEFMKDDGTYLEIWNLVFMQFNTREDGVVEDLPRPSIDTGMGLERVAAVVQGKKANYDTDLFHAIISKIESVSGVKYDGSRYNIPVAEGDDQYKADVAMRIIADHARAIAFLISDGALPSSEGAGYVLRRLIRRAARSGGSLGIDKPFLGEIIDAVEERMSEAYPELKQESKNIRRVVLKEEEQFQRTLRTGLALLDERTKKLKTGDDLPGAVAFQLYDTYGFPVDLTEEILADRGVGVDQKGFDEEMAKQKDRSKGNKDVGDSVDTSELEKLPATEFIGYAEYSAQAKLLGAVPAGQDGYSLAVFDKSPFYAEKGGQVGDSGQATLGGQTYEIAYTKLLPGEQHLHLIASPDLSASIGETFELVVDKERRAHIAQHHSGTHIVNAGLGAVLGDHVKQKGSLVTDERLRFDFSHDKALTADEIAQIEDFVNNEIEANHPVATQELPKEEAIAAGAVAEFGEKYADVVRVVEMGPSKELCGGTHVERTGDIGMTVVTGESSISSGVRRIEAVCGAAARRYIAEQQGTLATIAKKLGAPQAEVGAKVDQLSAQLKEMKQKMKEKDALLAKMLSDHLASQAEKVGAFPVVAESIDIEGRDGLLQAADFTIQKMDEGVVALGNKKSGMIVIKVSKALSKKIGANDLLTQVKTKIGTGKGGGKPAMATLMLDQVDKFPQAFEALKASISEHAA